MTDSAIAAALVRVQILEREARGTWGALAPTGDEEFQAVTAVVRQAGALRKSLEQWIVTRATTASRATADAGRGA